MLKTTIMRLKKQVVTLQDASSNSAVQPDFVKYHDPTSMQPYDVKRLMAEPRRLKKENAGLQEERLLLKVASDKYEKRAIYVRKKY